MKKFALLVPTRDREKLARRLLTSLVNTTKNPQDVEILFAVDHDDFSTTNYVNKIIADFGMFDIRMYLRGRSEFINRDYYNWLADQSTAEYVWVMADDLEMIQPNWDIKIYPRIIEYSKDKPDKVFCVSIKDNTPVPRSNMPKFPCFPMFPREAAAFFGWWLHPDPPTWGTDYIIYNIYKPANRLLEIHEDNYLNHISYHSHQCEQDHISIRVGSIYNRLKMVPKYNTDRILAEDCPKLTAKLVQHIRDYNERMAQQVQ